MLLSYNRFIRFYPNILLQTVRKTDALGTEWLSWQRSLNTYQKAIKLFPVKGNSWFFILLLILFFWNTPLF